MKVNWKVRFKFVKSLRFRILVILIIIGIVPSIIVEKGKGLIHQRSIILHSLRNPMESLRMVG